jgi:hypothetical protein
MKIICETVLTECGNCLNNTKCKKENLLMLLRLARHNTLNDLNHRESLKLYYVLEYLDILSTKEKKVILNRE